MKAYLLLALLSLPAWAEETQRPRFAAAFGPAWSHALRDNYAGAFAPNGFAAPSRDRLGFDLLGYWTTESGWQLGLGLGFLSFEQDSGAASAGYENDVIGGYLAWNFSPSTSYDLTAGTLFGIDDANLTVFSATRNGRLRETSALLAPSVGYATAIYPRVKAGLRFTYFVPFGESSQLNGQDLGVSRIAVRGFQLALNLILGRY